MRNLVLHYNQNCQDCVNQARMTAKLDWLRRIDLSTENSPLGATPIGEIVVVDRASNKLYSGVYAVRKVCMQVPLFFVYGLLLYFPPLRDKVDGKKPGCNGDACQI